VITPVFCAAKRTLSPSTSTIRHKVREVTVIAAFGGWRDLLLEIDKCRVLCANCHRRHTAAAAGRLR